MIFLSLSPCAPENLVSRGRFGPPVLIHTQAGSISTVNITKLMDRTTFFFKQPYIHTCRYTQLKRYILLVEQRQAMYGHSPHTYRNSTDQPGKVASLARGQLNRKNGLFPVRIRSCLRIWSRETGSAVPSRVSLLISIHTQAESGAYLRDSSRVPRWPCVLLIGICTSSSLSRLQKLIELYCSKEIATETASTVPSPLVLHTEADRQLLLVVYYKKKRTPRHGHKYEVLVVL